MKLPRLLYFYLINYLFSIQKAQSAMENKIFSRKQNGPANLLTQLVITQCLNQQPENIIVTEDSKEESPFIFPSNWIPVYLFSTKTELLKKHKGFSYFATMNETIAKTKVHPVTIITIAITSKSILTSLLRDIRNSIWWSNQAFFLVYNNDYANGCRLASEFLRVIWKFNVLSTIYFCWNEQTKAFIYTFSPYGRTGSAFWKAVSYDRNEDNWLLLSHSFENWTNSEDISGLCNDLKFDRLKNLNRWSIKIGSEQIEQRLPDGRKVDIVNDLRIFVELLNKLNGSYTYKHYSEFGYMSAKGPTSYMIDMQYNSIDVISNTRLMRSYWKLHTYPYEYYALCLVTAKESVRQLLIFHPTVTALVTITCLLSIAYFKFVLKTTMVESILECLRMLISVSTVTIERHPFHRFLMINLIFLTSFNSVNFQSLISADRTVPRYNMIDSVKDLLKTKLPVVGSLHDEELIHPKQLHDRFIPGKAVNCLRSLYAGYNNVSCLIHSGKIAIDQNLGVSNVHVAKQQLFSRPSAFLVSPDWPLLVRVNQRLGYIFETGIYQHLSKTQTIIRLAKKFKSGETNVNLNSITISQVAFYFYVLLGGCGVAFCSLLVELAVHKYLRKN